MPTPAVRSILLAALTASNFAAADNIPTQHNEATVAQLEADMTAGKLTSEQLTREYIARIDALDQSGPGVNAVIELNPDAIAMAKNADACKKGTVLGPLHGIPVLLKDNIDTGDKMQTTAGSFALMRRRRCRTPRSRRTCAGGAVILADQLRGRTSAPSNRSAAGPAAAGRRTIRTASTAIPAARAPARAPRRRRTSPPCRSVPRPTAASSARPMRTTSSASSRQSG